MADELSVFAIEGTRDYGERVARHLDRPLSPHEEREFEDGEYKIRPLAGVRRQDVFAIHSLHGDARQSPTDKLCRLLFMIGALKDAGAERVTAVVPYLCFGRKDRRTQPQDPITTKYVARLFEASGADAVITVDVHNLAAFENAFRCPVMNLEAAPLFVDHFVPLLRGQKLAVVSPDIGGAKRAERFRRAFAAQLSEEPAAAFVEKRRGGGVVSGDLLAGDLRGRTAILVDDLVSTGTTLQRAARACLQAGASRVFAAATHGLFTHQAAGVLGDPAFAGIVVTDTVQSAAAATGRLPETIRQIDSTKLVADVIVAAHAGC